MKTGFFVLCLVVVSYAQLDRDGSRTEPTRVPLTRPPPDGTRFDTRDNDESTCDVPDRVCDEVSKCFQSRLSDGVITRCMTDVAEDGACMRREIIQGDIDQTRVLNDREFSEERVARERGSGARDRDTARTVNGARDRPQCGSDLTCMDDVCRRRATETVCAMARMRNETVQCDADGMFRPLQCRPAEDRQFRALCYCANRASGNMIANTMRRVIDRDDLPQCDTRSLGSCRVRRSEGQMVSVRHGNSISRNQNGRCQKCRCNDGMPQCRNISNTAETCPRSNPDVRPANCTMDGVVMSHGDRRQEGKCNMCGCRNGMLRCTRLRECRDEDNDARSDDEEEVDDQCDDCMDMPNGPVCAVRDGRTFPTRCHAMRCQNFEMTDLRNGSCSRRDACEEDERCNADFSCMRRGGETRMSRESDTADNRRLCVNRSELRCESTEVTRDGIRRIRDSDDNDMFLERLQRARDENGDADENGDENGDDEGENDRTVCASDRNTYPSTCHMLTEARGDMVPRVMHPGRCRPMSEEMRMVCATDGVTYNDERTMRTQGGNVRMDYMGRCDDRDNSDRDATPNLRCKRVKDDDKCPEVPDCGRWVMLSDGCCPVCGSVVVMAMDQEAVDERVRVAGDLKVDDVMTLFSRGDGEREPIIDDMAGRMCEISMTRPTKTRGSTADVLFRARTGPNAAYCHEQAMGMMMRLNTAETTVSPEQELIAAAIVAPEAVVDGQGGAPTFAASCVVLLGASIVALLF